MGTYASPCYVRGEPGKWSLEVDGKPFQLKGVGCARAKGKSGINYLKIAKELGANTVRTWGIDKGNKEYPDEADKLGLKVDAGKSSWKQCKEIQLHQWRS